MNEIYILKILRGHPGRQYWEEFELKLTPMANVISSLMEIQRLPINRKGGKSHACRLGIRLLGGSMRILFHAHQWLSPPSLYGPNRSYHQFYRQFYYSDSSFTKFPLIRDLIVDRSRMFEDLKRVHAWIDVDGIHDQGPGPKISPENRRSCTHFQPV